MDVDVPKVLVLDANQRSALAVTRSLGRSGQYHVSTADSVASSLAGASRYSHRYFRYPDPTRHPQDFLAWIDKVVAEHGFALVMPTTEVTSQLLLRYQDRLEGVNLPFASYQKVMELADKIALVRLAGECDVPVPQSQAFENAGQVKPEDLRFPVVLKPALSRIFREDHWVHTQVEIVRDRAEWDAALAKHPYLQDSPFMLQEFIPGHGSGVFCLYDRGRPVQFFAHQRLREKPPEGGVSVLSRSVPVNAALKQASERLLSAVEWHGVAMVEFRISDDGQPYLMEINTRFWGSLQLAIDAGVDFPLMLANCHLKRPNAPLTEYRDGQQLRWLLGDLDSLYIYLKRKHALSDKLKRVLAFIAIRFRNQKHEINRLSDLKPAWVELKQYLESLR